MRTVKIKAICSVAANGAHSCLQNPNAKLGHCGSVRTVEITGIPDAMADSDVVRIWDRTADIGYLGNNGEYPRHSYRFEELGEGRIIRA